jgi:hypothetical protein
MNRSWLIGFLEGEASFTIIMALQASQHIRVSPCFSIAQTERQIVTKIHRFLGLGHIQHVPKEQFRRAGIPGANDQWKIVVGGYGQCRLLSELLPVTSLETQSKQRKYSYWIEALHIMRDGAHLIFPGLVRIAEIRDLLHGHRQDSHYRTAREWHPVVQELYRDREYSSRQIRQAVGRSATALRQLVDRRRKNAPKDSLIHEVWLCTFCRQPTAGERHKVAAGQDILDICEHCHKRYSRD